VILLRAAPDGPSPAWRTYDCPNCWRPNFSLLPSPIVDVLPVDEVLTLRPDCSSCGRQVQLRFVGWKDQNYLRNPEWQCPDCCHVNVLVTYGLVIGTQRIPQS